MTWKMNSILNDSNSMNFVTMDPGVRDGGGTGLALFSVNPRITNPIKIEQFSPFRKNSDHNFKCNEVIYNIETYFKRMRLLELVIEPTKVYIEKPQFFDTAKGQTAARSDSLFKLIYFYGRLYQLISSLGHTPIPLEIFKWKGQLSKSQVKTRVEKITNLEFKGDIIDAVGMGLHIKGLFK